MNIRRKGMRKVDGKIPWILTPHLHPPFVLSQFFIFLESHQERNWGKKAGVQESQNTTPWLHKIVAALFKAIKSCQKSLQDHIPKIGSNHSVQSSQADGAFTSSSSVHPQNQILFLKNIHIKCIMWPDHVSDLIRTHSRISSWVCKTF